MILNADHLVCAEQVVDKARICNDQDKVTEWSSETSPR